MQAHFFDIQTGADAESMSYRIRFDRLLKIPQTFHLTNSNVIFSSWSENQKKRGW